MRTRSAISSSTGTSSQGSWEGRGERVRRENFGLITLFPWPSAYCETRRCIGKNTTEQKEKM
eukprot:5078736-Alexandrium_andersonii.AAC.1